MMNEPKAMREIHEIREKLYEETKHMTPEEQTEHTRKEAQALIEKYGLRFRHMDALPEHAISESLSHTLVPGDYQGGTP